MIKTLMATAALCALCAFASPASAESNRADCRSANVPWYWNCDKPTSGERHVGPGIDNARPEPEPEPDPCEWEHQYPSGDERTASLLSVAPSPSVNSFSKGTGDGKQSGGNASNSGNGGRQ